MPGLPEDIVNRALDAAGSELVIGNLDQGSREAQVSLRAYGPIMRALLRAAHWNFARQTTTLQLLADATGQTQGVGTLVPTPWTYEYSLPIDCMKARFVPAHNHNHDGQAFPGSGNNISMPNTPLTAVSGAPTTNHNRIIPARFTIATDFNYSAVAGNLPWVQGTQWWEVQGVSPSARTVVLTNVKHAQLVYTALIIYPSLWDSLFEDAMVAALAAEIALPLNKDKKLGLAIRSQNVAIAKEKIKQARIRDGDEGVFSTDHTPDWMRVRNRGSIWGFGGPSSGLGGGDYGGWDSISFADGSAY